MASPLNGSQYPASATARTGTAYIDALVGTVQWGLSRGAPISLTYSFPYASGGATTWASNYSSTNEPSSSFALNAAQQAAVRAAMATWSSVANVSFTEVADTSASVGDIRVTWSNLVSSSSAAVGYFPSSFAAAGGDIWLSAGGIPQRSDDNFWLPDASGFEILIHELGHALGLTHPGNNPTDPAYTAKTTVMSYNSWPGDLYFGRFGPGGNGVAYQYAYVTPQTPSIYDIAAVQSLYGANTAYRSGSDAYQFDVNKPFFKTLWDGGGVDEISVANFSAACTIDLNPGTYSSIRAASEPFPPFTSGTAPTYLGNENLGIAFGCIIENATGGSGADTLRGNAVANVLFGGAGNDTLSGGAGADTFFFTASGNNIDTILDFEGGDQIRIQASLSTQPLAPGNGATVSGRHAELSGSGSATTLWIDTDGFAGAEMQVIVNGSWTTSNLRVVANADGSSSILRNSAPVVGTVAASQIANAQRAFSFVLPAGSFSDADVGDGLTYALSLANGGALPGWIGFNAATRTVSGTPLASDVAVLNLRVTARDAVNASTSQDFKLVVVPAGFDALNYIASYPDLRAAFGLNTLAAATHYVQAGMAEGRVVSFDPSAYTASYPDLIRAFGLDSAGAARHYIANGSAEGRTVTFDALAYIASYADLIGAFGLDGARATRHFVGNGFNEGRTVTFNALRYTASYRDLITAFGTDTGVATRHYINAGYFEGRAVSFDPAQYLANYADLRAAFGTNLDLATRHYIVAGVIEGRTASPLAAPFESPRSESSVAAATMLAAGGQEGAGDVASDTPMFAAAASSSADSEHETTFRFSIGWPQAGVLGELASQRDWRGLTPLPGFGALAYGPLLQGRNRALGDEVYTADTGPAWRDGTWASLRPSAFAEVLAVG